MQRDPLAGKPATGEAKRNPTCISTGKAHLLGAMDRGRMKDAPPAKWTGQRCCAALWEGSWRRDSIPECPLATLSMLPLPSPALGAAGHRAQPGCTSALPGSGLSACTNSDLVRAGVVHTLGHRTGLIRADVPA